MSVTPPARALFLIDSEPVDPKIPSKLVDPLQFQLSIQMPAPFVSFPTSFPSNQR
jgi:hypothetical protein